VQQAVQRITAHTTFTLTNYDIIQASADETTASSITGKTSAEVNDHLTGFTGPNAALLSGHIVVDANPMLTFYDTPTGQNFNNFTSSHVYG
jgi:hypothetical protein